MKMNLNCVQRRVSVEDELKSGDDEEEEKLVKTQCPSCKSIYKFIISMNTLLLRLRL